MSTKNGTGDIQGEQNDEVHAEEEDPKEVDPAEDGSDEEVPHDDMGGAAADVARGDRVVPTR